MKTFGEYLTESKNDSAYKVLHKGAMKLIHDKFGNPLKKEDADAIEEYIWGDDLYGDISNKSGVLNDIDAVCPKEWDAILKKWDDLYNEYGDSDWLEDEDAENPANEEFKEATFPILGRAAAAVNKELGEKLIDTLNWD